MNDLLKEAIADASRLRETVIANARLQLEEEIVTPRLKESFSKTLKEAYDPTTATDPHGYAKVREGKESVDLKSSGIGSSGESGVSGGFGDEKTGPAPEESDSSGPSANLKSSGIGKDGESSGDQDRGAAKKEPENGPGLEKGKDGNVVADLKEAADDEEEEDDEKEDDDEINEGIEDIQAIIDQLQAEVDALTGGEFGDDEFGDDDGLDLGVGDEPAPDAGLDMGADEPAPDMSGEDEFGADDEEKKDDEMEEDFDIESILREIEAELSEESGAELATENARLQAELDEYRQAVELLRSKLNEVNLLNAKLLYTNKLFKNKTLTTEDKIHIVETFDLATTLREVKLLYATLSEAKFGSSRKKVATDKTVVTEGLASRSTGASTAPKKEEQVLTENENTFKRRMQELAGIKVL